MGFQRQKEHVVTTNQIRKRFGKLRNIDLPNEIRYDQIAADYKKVTEQIERVIEQEKKGPWIGDIPVTTISQTSRYLDLLKIRKSELESLEEEVCAKNLVGF